MLLNIFKNLSEFSNLPQKRQNLLNFRQVLCQLFRIGDNEIPHHTQHRYQKGSYNGIKNDVVNQIITFAPGHPEFYG